jgi:formylmethanofuran dehydrogenase subunit E
MTQGFKKIGEHTFDEFIEMATLFHNYPAPGLILGGYMVEEAKRHIPEGTLFEAISETSWCLPDAIQMLTPCTIGNGWVRVMNFGLYAMSLFDKHTGKGVRVWLDMHKLAPDSEIRSWYLKLKPKHEQDSDRLLQEIGEAGADILSVRPIQLRSDLLVKRSKGGIGECPVCHEAYPIVHGPICRSCKGENPYDTNAGDAAAGVVYPLPSAIKTVAAEEAMGREVVHDMTSIDPGKSKAAAFRKGQVFEIGDLCRLQHMGRNNLYIESGEVGEDWVHEDDCAKAFASAMSGVGVVTDGEPHEGKVTLKAAHDGLFRVNTDALYAFNLCPGVMAASRSGWTVVKEGAEVAGTRAIPLYLQRNDFVRAMQVLDSSEVPLFSVLPLRKAKVGVLITGDEVFSGKIEDRFEEIIRRKVTALGSEVHRAILVPDNREMIRDNARTLLDDGCNIIITTAGLSVDPDDVTRHGLVDAGAHDMLYGAPLLPGTMTLIGKIGTARLLGVPACALFFKHTSLDLILPRLLADVDVTRDDLARMGEGGMCLGCANCTFPKCPFGK